MEVKKGTPWNVANTFVHEVINYFIYLAEEILFLLNDYANVYDLNCSNDSTLLRELLSVKLIFSRKFTKRISNFHEN